MTKKSILYLSILVLILLLTACSQKENQYKNISPEISQMRMISNLAVMECYYHNVAKYKEEDAEGFWIWKKDKHFWIEYSGIVEIGIDATQLNIDVNGNKVKITLPEAKVLGTKIDEIALEEAIFIKDKKSAKITGIDEAKAFESAEEKMIEAASKDTALLANAQQRVQKLLEEYVANIGRITGNEYSIEWNYISLK
jgi:hypothetical protein